MTREDVLQLIESDAQHFYLAAGDALPAFVEILVEKAAEFSREDLTTLTAIGSVLLRTAEAERWTRMLLDRVKAGSRKA